MPFELGLAAALAIRKDIRQTRTGRHQFRLLEARSNRVQRSLSDLNGYEAFIHHARPLGVFASRCATSFTSLRPFPIGDASGFRGVHRASDRVRRSRSTVGGTLYTPDRFSQVVFAATALVRDAAAGRATPP